MSRLAAAALTVLLVVAIAGAARASAQDSGPKVGDLAPDFTLPSLDKKSTVTLASLRGSKPVVLVFGSYT